MSIITKEIQSELESMADEFGKILDKHNLLHLNEDEYIFAERLFVTYRKTRAIVASIRRYLDTGELPPKGPAQPAKGTRA